jgi:hypothetical protein
LHKDFGSGFPKARHIWLNASLIIGKRRCTCRGTSPFLINGDAPYYTCLPLFIMETCVEGNVFLYCKRRRLFTRSSHIWISYLSFLRSGSHTGCGNAAARGPSHGSRSSRRRRPKPFPAHHRGCPVTAIRTQADANGEWIIPTPHKDKQL